MNHITIEQAKDMGAKGAQPTEEERLLFEAWMAGHCWMVEGDWDGETYVHPAEKLTRQVWPGAMRTRMLWAAWRDRAALAAPVQEPVAWRYTDARGHYRYRGYVPNFDVEYKLLKPQPLYTTPPAAQRQWVGLTMEDKQEYMEQDYGGSRLDALDWADRRLREKNAAAQPALKPLTYEQIESLWDHGMYVHCSGITALRAITRAIEAAHSITEKGNAA